MKNPMEWTFRAGKQFKAALKDASGIKPQRPVARLGVAAMLSVLLPLATPAFTHAADYRSVGENAAVLQDAPGPRAAKKFVAPKGMPLEIVLPDQGGYTKVRERGGELLWIETRALTNRRMLVVAVAQAQVRAAGEDNAALVFEARQDVALEALDPPNPSTLWVRVRHRDGQTGFVKLTQVWGWQ
jgi:SH3-like domain-containing protein